jgi:hypothetical protein
MIQRLHEVVDLYERRIVPSVRPVERGPDATESFPLPESREFL